jgi:hypothetical protein
MVPNGSKIKFGTTSISNDMDIPGEEYFNFQKGEKS